MGEICARVNKSCGERDRFTLARCRARVRVWSGRCDAQRMVAPESGRARVGGFRVGKRLAPRGGKELRNGSDLSLLLRFGRTQETITACVLWAEGKGKGRKEKKNFGTFTHDLLQLADWLQACGVRHVAMESTGVYWKPVWNILAEQFEILLVNAQHIKAVPGRKTDQKDSEWIADLLQHGLLRGSFVPPQPTRELRDLTRYRVSLAQEINRIANRIQKVLEDANIKLASVATDALGASGRAMLEAMLAGEQDPERLAEMSKGLLRNKIPELKLALAGRVTEHHRFLLRQLYDHLRFTESKRREIEQEIERHMRPFQDEVTRLCTIPGVDRVTAWGMLAEIGLNMNQASP